METITYRQKKSGRTMEVGEWETTRRAILERSGWAADVPDKSAAVDKPAAKPAKEAPDAPTVEAVAERAGVPHLRDALLDAGFVSAESIADANADDLTAVSGIGKATAKKLQTAASELVDG